MFEQLDQLIEKAPVLSEAKETLMFLVFLLIRVLLYQREESFGCGYAALWLSCKLVWCTGM
jgi:hypothetical protein